jgi:spermidine synthase
MVIAAVGELAVLRDRERPTGRLLRQGDMDARDVDLADPSHLEFDYLRRMRDVVELTKSRHVVHVGGAGCALARSLATADPENRQEVVEIDGRVVELARRHLGLRRAPGLRVRVGDGRELLEARRDGSVDAVLVDAFVGARVPRHLATAEACADYARVARVAAVNVVDVRSGGDAAAIAAGLRSAFEHVLAVGAGGVLARRRTGNIVLVGAHEPLPIDRLRARAAADPSPAVMLEPQEMEAFCGGAVAWRDL